MIFLELVPILKNGKVILRINMGSHIPYLPMKIRRSLIAFGVWGPKKFMGKEYDGIHRTTFVINEDGILDDVITKVKTKDHTSQIL